MLTFWGVAIILLVATLGVLLRPLLWVQKGKSAESMLELQAIYRQQYAELELDKANRLLDTQQYEIARSELARRLLEDTTNQPAKISTTAFTADKPLAVSLVLLIPIAAILIYLKVGNPQVITSHVIASAEQATQNEQATANIEAILKSLYERLEQDPADGAGWQLLARGYAKLHRYDEAAQAFDNATKVITDDPQLLTDYAIVLAMMQEQKLNGKPELFIRQALKIEPNDPKALMLAASAAFDRQDYKEAIRLWTQLESQLPAGSEARSTVEIALKRATELSRQP